MSLKRRGVLIVAAIALVVLGAGFALGRVTAPGTPNGATDSYVFREGTLPKHGSKIVVGNGGPGTWQHFYENFSSTTTTTSARMAVVPNAVGLDQRTGTDTTAMQLLEKAGFGYQLAFENISPGPNCGLVQSQRPAAGSAAHVGSVVVLLVAIC